MGSCCSVNAGGEQEPVSESVQAFDAVKPVHARRFADDLDVIDLEEEDDEPTTPVKGHSQRGTPSQSPSPHRLRRPKATDESGVESPVAFARNSADKMPELTPKLVNALNGVSLRFLEVFASRHKDKYRDMSTADVVEHIIKPQSTAMSVTDRLINDRQRNMVGRATVFVSHCWSYKFADLLETLLTLEEASGYDSPRPGNKGKKEVYVWLDIFCVNQHDRPDAFFLKLLRDIIVSIQRTMLVLVPLNNPVPIKRLWCLYEIYVSARKNVPFDIRLPPQEEARFREATRAKAFNFLDWVSSIRVENAATSVEEEKELLLGDLTFLAGPRGAREIDQTVLKTLRSWMAQRALNLLENPEETKQVAGGQNRRASLGTGVTNLGDPTTKRRGSLGNLMELLNAQGQLDDAEAICRGTLKSLEVSMGPNSPVTNTARRNLALLLQRQGNLNDAQPLLETVLELNQNTFGMDDQKTLGSMSDMASLLMDRGKYLAALRLMEEVVTASQTRYGRDSIPSVSSMQSFAEALYKVSGKQRKAEAVFKESLVYMEKIYGHQHQRVLLAQNRLATLLLEEGRHASSEEMYEKIAQATRDGGLNVEMDPIAGESAYNLGILHEMNGKFEDALDCYTTAANTFKDLYGEKDVRTIKCRRRQAALLSP